MFGCGGIQNHDIDLLEDFWGILGSSLNWGKK
jgi:hypothetical protein